MALPVGLNSWIYHQTLLKYGVFISYLLPYVLSCEDDLVYLYSPGKYFLILIVLGSGKMLSGGPQDMDKAAGHRVPRPGIDHLGADIQGTGIDPALVISEPVISEPTFKEPALIRHWSSRS